MAELPSTGKVSLKMKPHSFIAFVSESFYFFFGGGGGGFFILGTLLSLSPSLELLPGVGFGGGGGGFFLFLSDIMY
ncbi:MAG: hypothetical protein ACI9K1_002065 [Arcticibacterium sp.]